ncbi:DUF4340 domain-containing protein [Ekhidna sp.]|uniref:DUF4340 domain-containing protein n=1 Tax=Ekhidna sp. TaxID=2608089 RepID=UPI0032EDBE20
MKTKNLLIILGVLVVGLAVVQLTKRSGKSDALADELVSIDTAKVSRVEVVTLEGTMSLKKSENGWEVSLPSGGFKQAKTSSITSLLTNLNTIKPGRLAARKQDKWNDYAVDSTGTRIRIFEGDDLSSDLVIGRFGMEGQRSYYTFVRLFDDENVYVADNFMGISVGKEAVDYRDGLLMRLKKDSLTQIKFDYPDSAFVLTKDEHWYLNDSRADSASVEQYLRGLSYVNSKNFYDAELQSNPSHTITYSFTNAPEIMVSGNLQDDTHIIQTTENRHEVFNDSTIAAKLFKGKNAFLPTSD